MNVKYTIIAYSLGICLSSLLVVFQPSLPIVRLFAHTAKVKLGEGDYASRFCGLQGNPNYYTLDVIIVLSAIVIMMIKRKTTITYIVLFSALTAFGMMSVSKSFILAWGVLVIFWMVASMREGMGNILKLLFVLVIAAVAIYYFAQDSVDAYVKRFASDSTGTMSSITTGRSNIWIKYFQEISESNKILFVGKGLNTMITTEKGAHNTYIESIFTLGIIGTALYFTAIKKAMGKIITNRLMLIPIGVLLFRMLAISMVVYDNLWFFLCLIQLLAKECRE